MKNFTICNDIPKQLVLRGKFQSLILFKKRFLLGQSCDSFLGLLHVTVYQLFVFDYIVDDLTT